MDFGKQIETHRITLKSKILFKNTKMALYNDTANKLLKI
jgi:hypothetical protein